MPRQRPLRGERFDISRLADAGEFTYISEPDRGGITATHTVAEMHALPNYERERWLLMLRNAGIWFADIATILNYPSASSASAAYVRECRRVGIEPQVRAENRRVNGQTAAMREQNPGYLPEFLDRQHFNGEFDDFGFGVEIEQVGIGRSNLVRIVQGLGYPVAPDTHYTHQGTTAWKAVPDGSLSGRETGELVSRVLRGHDGFVELRHILLALKAEGSRVNSSCGQHVHIGIENLSQRTQAMVIRAHSMFNHVFDLMLNPSRRNHESYAAHTPHNVAMHNARAFEEGRPYDAQCAKYRSLNIGHYQDYGTFEFRSLHGCLNPRHTVSWLQLHFDFIMFCEKVGRLTSSHTDELLDWDMLNPEVREMWRKMPLTMRVLSGDISQTEDGIAERTGNYASASGNTITETEAMVQYALNNVQEQGQHPQRLLISPVYSDTGVGVNSLYGVRHWRGIRWSERQIIDPHHTQRWIRHGFDVDYERRAERDGDNLNVTAQWAYEIMREWVSDTSFVGNATVRKVMREMCEKQFGIDPINYPTNR